MVVRLDQRGARADDAEQPFISEREMPELPPIVEVPNTLLMLSAKALLPFSSLGPQKMITLRFLIKSVIALLIL